MKKEPTIPELIAELQKQIIETDKNFEKVENLERLKEVAKAYAGDDEVITTEEVIRRMALRKDEVRYLSHFKDFDAILGGFYPNQLVVISAATKSGKTSWCVDLTIRMKELNPLWFPFEESAEELLQKFIDRKEEPPIFCTPKVITGNTLLWIEKKIIESIAKYNTKVVFIDHLHFIVPFSEERQDLRIGETMRTLKGLAKRWGITIFLIAHLKKTRVDTSPTLEDLRDSSFIAQESDTVIILWRESKREDGHMITTNNVNVSVQANRRHGKTGNVKMVFKNGHFFEMDWRPPQEISEAEQDFNNFK